MGLAGTTLTSITSPDAFFLTIALRNDLFFEDFTDFERFQRLFAVKPTPNSCSDCLTCAMFAGTTLTSITSPDAFLLTVHFRVKREHFGRFQALLPCGQSQNLALREGDLLNPWRQTVNVRRPDRARNERSRLSYMGLAGTTLTSITSPDAFYLTVHFRAKG